MLTLSRFRLGQPGRLPVGPLLVVGALALYSRTLAPSLGGTTDSAEFQQAGYALALVHPTGYPLYLLIGRLWMSLLPLGDPAFRLNALSAVFAALAVGVLYALARDVTGRPLAAAAAAALFAVQAIPWAEAGVAEINTLNTLLTGLLFWAIVRWARGHLPLPLLLGIAGLALSHHRTTALYVPLLIVYAVVAWRRGSPQATTRRAWVAGLALGLLPFLAYLYIPLRAHTAIWYQPTWAGLRQEILGDSALPGILTTLQRSLGPRLQLVFGQQAFRGTAGWALAGLGLPGLALAVLVAAGRRIGGRLLPAGDPAALALCAAGSFIGFAFAVVYDIVDINEYLAVPLFLWCALVAATLAAGATAATALLAGRPQAVYWRRLGTGALGLALLGLIGFSAARSLARVDLRVDFSTLDRRAAWQTILPDPLPPASILIGDTVRANEALYFQRVEGWRPDLIVVFVDDALAGDGLPIDNWLHEGRGVYLLGQYDGVLTRFTVTPRSSLWQVQHRGAAETAPALTHRLDRRFGDNIVLLGYSVTPDPPALAQAGTLQLTLYWQATSRVYTRYTIFNHIRDSGGRIVGQQDDEPGHGFQPTVVWQPGQTVVTPFTIPLHPDAGSGTYRLITGLYNSVTQERLPAFSAAGQALSDYPELTVLTVR